MVTEPQLVEIWVKNKTLKKGFKEVRTKTSYSFKTFRKEKLKKQKYIYKKK
jgi:hypothetical protein